MYSNICASFQDDDVASVSADGRLSIHRLHRMFQTKFVDENIEQPTCRYSSGRSIKITIFKYMLEFLENSDLISYYFQRNHDVADGDRGDHEGFVRFLHVEGDLRAARVGR